MILLDIKFKTGKATGRAMSETVHSSAVTRIRTWVVSATTRSTNHYTITANRQLVAKEQNTGYKATALYLAPS